MAQPASKRLVTEATAPGIADASTISRLQSVGVLTLDMKLNLYNEARVSDFGTLSTSSSADHTAVFTAAMDAAKTKGVPVKGDARVYAVENLVVPAGVVLGPDGGTTSRYGMDLTDGGTRKGTWAFRRKGAFTDNTSTAPMITCQGAGSGIRGVVLHGAGAPGTILQMVGFETVLESVRLISGGGIALDCQKVNNNRWRYIYVDNSGGATDDLPAVKIWSKDGVGGAAETNNMDVYSLTIERCKNLALDIAYDQANATTPGSADLNNYWAEFVRFFGLHIEASALDGANASPLIRIGNVRAVDFVAPMIYGGSSTGPLVQYAMQKERTSAGNGGVRFIGGELLGPDPAIGTATVMPYAVDAVSGNQLSIQGTRMLRWGTAGVRAQSTFGAQLTIDPEAVGLSRVRNTADTATLPVLEDNRAARTVLPMLGDTELNGRFLSKQAAVPAYVKPAAFTSGSLNGTSTDVKGIINTTVGGSATAANIVVGQVTYNKTYGSQTAVTLSSMNAATFDAGLYVATTATNFSVYARNAIPASTVLQVGYHVIGNA